MLATIRETNTSMDTGQKAKILVVDDEQLIQQLISFKLRSAGHNILLASNGEEAIALAEEQLPDLIIMDVTMPVLSGVETLARLKSDPRTVAIPVIMLTGYSAEKSIAEGLELGAEDYITKPFSPSELAARVEIILQRSHAK
ncbi:MAG TPA: response regulator [Candidatus Kapabacteria bacterium]|nr:response regulator [Candidatus Kapabacteria bacterium]